MPKSDLSGMSEGGQKSCTQGFYVARLGVECWMRLLRVKAASSVVSISCFLIEIEKVLDLVIQGRLI
jgi:hypothetical protein